MDYIEWFIAIVIIDTIVVLAIMSVFGFVLGLLLGIAGNLIVALWVYAFCDPNDGNGGYVAPPGG